ncbi:hypothetical protein [Natronorubrum sp. FCH18a]|uniref:hypothetical protein n=1 Tax=Natronorubrum sp. FCH18a TaxID=3447018 RepID=UPI003F5198A5
MTAHTPLQDRSVAPPTESSSDDSASDQPPSLDDLEDDELIRCCNPGLEFLTWYYELDSDGSVLTYHCFDDFEVSTDTEREQADQSIEHENVTATIVTRETLEALQGGDA